MLPQLSSPSLEDIEQARIQGFRPTVVACVMFNKKLLFILKKVQHTWVLPQGGVEQNETIEEALHREFKEELGEDIVRKSFTPLLLEVENIPFSSASSKKRPIVLHTGETVKMIGKCFYVMMVLSKQIWIPVKEGEYDTAKWMTYEESVKTVEKMHQEAKKELLLKILHTLYENNHLL